jgi:hypothetical protein
MNQSAVMSRPLTGNDLLGAIRRISNRFHRNRGIGAVTVRYADGEQFSHRSARELSHIRPVSERIDAEYKAHSKKHE